MLQYRNKGVFFYTKIGQFNKQYFSRKGLFDMRKIVTRKARFELEADGLLEPGDRDHILSGVFNQFLSANPRASRINKKSANNPALID